MMNKTLLYSLALSIALLILTAGGFSQEDVETVHDSAFEKQMRPAVFFFHDTHNENAGIDDCTVCHHMYENGQKSEYDDSVGMECSECHLNNSNNSEADLIRVYHLQCGGCHMKQKSGPILCGECHIRH